MLLWLQPELKDRLIAFHPEFAQKFRITPPKPPEIKKEYHFKQGDILKQGEEAFPPPQAGKSIHVRAAISPVYLMLFSLNI